MRYREPHFSAAIHLIGQQIVFQLENKTTEFRIDHIQVIGEFSAPPGLLSADYFFSFKLRGQNQLVDIPAYTEGLFDEVLPQLRRYLPGIGNPKLQMSTELASNVLYPAHVSGLPMYKFSSEAKPMINLPVLRKLGNIHKVVKGLNPEVLAAVY
ncbi:MAG TPA: hypothetical protein ENJ82_06565 [Bacteroidetes bacterium]|nr:hypothetical protein [Bacteroidota bacterium]